VPAAGRIRKGGRKPAMDEKQKDLARRMLTDPHTTVGEVAETFGVSPATIYRHVGAVSPGRNGKPARAGAGDRARKEA
jgi:DNA invertase Pin-like site-specific DNA recombinase